MTEINHELLKKNAPAPKYPTQQAEASPPNYNAFVDQKVRLPALETGMLDGITFAVKDVFDIQGVTSGAGNPDWLRTHEPAASTAPALVRLLKNGASLEGTTQTDEIMYSLNGENAHYGTPVNPAAPDRIPGGSSSGSAVAAAAGVVDLAIGTDTGGSVRIPSSYCGIYGFRPTHGAVSAEGVIPLAHSFDTVGWMSRDIHVLLKTGCVLLNGEQTDRGSLPVQPSLSASFARFYVAEEAWALLDSADRQILLAKLHSLSDWQDGGKRVQLTHADQTLADWSAGFRVLQGLEIAREHGEWIEREQPSFGPGIAERFQWASTLEASSSSSEMKLRDDIRNSLSELLGENGLLAIPTAPGPAPLLGLNGAEAEAYRAKVMQLSCIAGLSGLPQLTIPVMRPDGLPLGLSFIGGRHTDLQLLHWAAEQFTKEVTL